MPLSKNAIKLLEARYCHPGEKPNDVFKRVANYLAANKREEKRFYKIMNNLDFLPNSPCLRNAGHGNMLSACFVLPIEDSMDSIFKALHDAGIIFKHGGGVGYNFSNLREKGALLSGGGTASGVISFLKIFDAITEAVKQGGFRRGACCSSDTLALTPQGWKNYKELKVGDEILTFNPEKEITEFQPILKLNVFDYAGDLINFDTKFSNLKITPNHRIIFKIGRKGQFYNIQQASDLSINDKFVPTSFPTNLNRKDYLITDNFIKLMGWIITEGTIKDRKCSLNTYSISQNERANSKNCKELDCLWDVFGWSYLKYPENNKHYHERGERNWYVPASAQKKIKLESNYKTIPRWALNKFSYRQLKLLFDTMMKGDGHRTKTWGKYSAKSEIAIDRFLELCTLLGYRASKKRYVVKRDNKIFKGFDVNINFEKHSYTLKYKNIKKVPYNGKVWCPTIENGFWVANDGTYVTITGNSMSILNANHPEIIAFITEKLRNKTLTNFNLSVRVNDGIMKAIEDNGYIQFRNPKTQKFEGGIKASTLFQLICTSAWLSGDPGLLFHDRINEDNKDNNQIIACNPCLTGDAIISTTMGEIPIKELVGLRPDIYTMKDGKLAIRKASNVFYTGTKKILKIKTLRGQLECTYDHKILTKNKGWVEAQDLEKGDNIVALSKIRRGKKYIGVRLNIQNRQQEIMEHQLVMEYYFGKYFNEEYDIHHIDDNAENNKITNLQFLPKNIHQRQHKLGNNYYNQGKSGRFVNVEHKKSSYKKTDNPNYRNWKVIAVEKTNNIKPVYDITIPDTHNFIANNIVVHNCGETHIYPYESCCLGSINLSNFVKRDGSLNRVALNKVIISGTKFLLQLNKKNIFPIDKCKEAVKKYNRIGLGVMGFADMLIKMGIYYDSKAALKIIDELGKLLQISHSIAIDSASTLSIAPTGSLSIIANCSPSIEPIFERNIERRLTIGNIKETRAIYSSKYVRTAHEISPEWHLNVQARFQRWIDNGVSKTVNLPHDADLDFVKQIYMKAWKSGCKGITIFRDGCLDNQVLYSAKNKCDGDTCHL